MKEIYLIYKAFSDTYENSPSDAFGFKIHGFYEAEQDAIDLCANSELVTKEKYGWAAQEGVKEYNYKPLCSLYVSTDAHKTYDTLPYKTINHGLYTVNGKQFKLEAGKEYTIINGEPVESK